MKKKIIVFLMFIFFIFPLYSDSEIFFISNYGFSVYTESFEDNKSGLYTYDYRNKDIIGKYYQNNYYNEKTGDNYGLEIIFLPLNNNGINISLNQTHAELKGEFRGRYPNPKTQNKVSTINWTEESNFNINQLDVNYIHRFHKTKKFHAFAYVGFSFFDGKPKILESVIIDNTLTPDGNIQTQSKKYNKENLNSTGLNLGVSLYSEIVNNLYLGLKTKYSHGAFKLERWEYDDLNIPLKNFKIQLSLGYRLQL